jgi:hypothetical protein
MRKARLSSLRGQASTVLLSPLSPIYLPCISPVSHQASTVLSPYHTELLNVASAAEVTHEAIMKQLEA